MTPCGNTSKLHIQRCECHKVYIFVKYNAPVNLSPTWGRDGANADMAVVIFIFTLSLHPGANLKTSPRYGV